MEPWVKYTWIPQINMLKQSELYTSLWSISQKTKHTSSPISVTSLSLTVCRQRLFGHEQNGYMHIFMSHITRLVQLSNQTCTVEQPDLYSWATRLVQLSKVAMEWTIWDWQLPPTRIILQSFVMHLTWCFTCTNIKLTVTTHKIHPAKLCNAAHLVFHLYKHQTDSYHSKESSCKVM